MKTITVERVHSKDITYQKDGQQKSFTKYAVLSQDNWYTLEGKGRDKVQEGDKLTGEYYEKDWQSGDKSGTEKILKLLDPVTADILSRLEKLEAKVFSNVPTKEEVNQVADDSELPF